MVSMVRTFSLIMIVSASLIALGEVSVHGQAPITWEAAAESQGIGDLRVTSNPFLYAFNGGGSIEIGGVPFTGGTFASLPAGTSFSPSTSASPNEAGLSASTGDANYDAMLDSFTFATSGVTSGSIQFSGLTAGTVYQIQLWFSDQRANFASRQMTFGDNGVSGNQVNLAGGAGDFGENVVGTFTAVSSVQSFSLQTNGFGNVHLNAFTLAEISSTQTELPPIVGSGLSIDSFDEWSNAIDRNTSNFFITGDQATSTTTGSIFESRLQAFTTKQSFQNMVVKQTPDWTAESWRNPSELDPSIYSNNDIGPFITSEGDRDAPVFISPQDGDYWVLDRQVTGRAFHAYYSPDMITWTDKGVIGDGFDWVTSAEYYNGQFFIYHDRPNDHDPSLVTVDYVAGSGGTLSLDSSGNIAATDHGVILDKPTVFANGQTFSLAGGSDNAIFRDPVDGQFHLIHEDWSFQNANRFSFDSNYSGHSTSPDGINGFVYGEATRLIDERGNLIDRADATDNNSLGDLGTLTLGGTNFEIGSHPNVNHLFQLTDQLHAWGDYAMIKVGDIYYLFVDDDSETEGIGLGYWYGDSLNSRFTYGGRLRDGLHPDPGVGFAEGNFLLLLQQTDGDAIPGNDLLSFGPWAQGVEARAGVDGDGDGVAEVWTDWQEISEEYSRIEGFAKAFDLEEASLDLSSLPAGYGIQFQLRSASGGVGFDSIEINSMSALLLGDANQDGVVDFFDISPFIDILSAGEFLDQADINQDGIVDFFDISPFIAILSS